MFPFNASRFQCLSVTTPVSSSFIGPGDIVSGAFAWWGLQAYSAAYASPGNNPAIDLNNDITGAFAGTVNILSNGLLDATTASTLISLGASRISKWYDQTGNGNHQLQSNNGERAQLSLTTGPGGNTPSALFTLGRGDQYAMSGSATVSQPFAMSTVANFNGGITGAEGLFGSTGDAGVFLGYRGSSNAFAISCPFEVTKAAPQNAFHAVQGICNGTSGEIYVDGASSGAVNAGTSGFTTALTLGIQQNGANWAGFISEFGIWQGLTSVTFPRASMNSNQHSRWGF